MRLKKNARGPPPIASPARGCEGSEKREAGVRLQLCDGFISFLETSTLRGNQSLMDVGWDLRCDLKAEFGAGKKDKIMTVLGRVRKVWVGFASRCEFFCKTKPTIKIGMANFSEGWGWEGRV